MTGAAKVDLDNVRLILTATREELSRADTKASILLAASGIAIGPALSAALAGSWSPARINDSLEWLWWLGILAAAMAVLSLGYAVYPRLRRRTSPTPTISFFGDIKMKSPHELADALAEPPDNSGQLLIDQLWYLSQIVSSKYRAIRLALWLFASAIGLATSSLILDTLI